MMNMAKPVKKKTVKAGLFYDGSGKPPLKDVYLTFDQKVLSVSCKHGILGRVSCDHSCVHRCTCPHRS